MGERAGVLYSYIHAYNKIPESISNWQDIIKIANGRWPGERNIISEKEAITSFIKIYNRQPDFKINTDENAIMVMAYGLRPQNRNLNSEREAINSFRFIFKKMPLSTKDWDMVRSIAYSGARR